jgi:hypothetical protein
MKKLLLPLLSILFLARFSFAADPGIVFPAKDAELSGGVNFEAQTGTIRDWREEGSSLAWKIDLPPATYKVSINYSLPKSSAGGRFEIATESSKSQINSIYPTGSWNEFKDKSLGTIKITPKDKTVTIKATKVPVGAWLMNLKSITFTKQPY